jgi:hypothetical protein
VNLDAVRGLSQPDQRTCGPTSLVAAHMLLDPAYAATQNPKVFATSVVALHRELTAPSASGRAQLPWPRALGTPPWAAARAMTSFTGLPYRTRVVRLGGRSDDFDAVASAVTDGHPVPLYVGSTWLPRHVVLAVGPTADGVDLYNPAHGRISELTRAAFQAGELTTTGRWDTPWFVITPRGRPGTSGGTSPEA